MHTPVPPDAQTALPACRDVPRRSPRNLRSLAGFSLIEVTLAIAIVAFAFISLIGLLPAGMAVFNQTMDATNEMRIVSDLSSMVQASDYDKLTATFSNQIYFYDVDGGFLDTKDVPVDDYIEKRIYAAKVIFDIQQMQEVKFDKKLEALKGLVLVGKYNDTVTSKLDSLQSAADVLALLRNPLPGFKIHVAPLIISKNDTLE
jgi:uncharacterized protein (TIGR02598 family)